MAQKNVEHACQTQMSVKIIKVGGGLLEQIMNKCYLLLHHFVFVREIHSITNKNERFHFLGTNLYTTSTNQMMKTYLIVNPTSESKSTRQQEVIYSKVNVKVIGITLI